MAFVQSGDSKTACCRKATETKRRTQNKCSIKGNRIKSNKNLKPANRGAVGKGDAARGEGIYSMLLNDNSSVISIPVRPFFFSFLLSDVRISFKKSSQYPKLEKHTKATETKRKK